MCGDYVLEWNCLSPSLSLLGNNNLQVIYGSYGMFIMICIGEVEHEGKFG